VQRSGVVWLRQVVLLLLEGSMAQADRRGLVGTEHHCGNRGFCSGLAIGGLEKELVKVALFLT
jgi:hypothetical protein